MKGGMSSWLNRQIHKVHKYKGVKHYLIIITLTV